jgi:hypothetical protein
LAVSEVEVEVKVVEVEVKVVELELGKVEVELELGKVEVELGMVEVELVTDEVVIEFVVAIGSRNVKVSVFDKDCRLVIVDVDELSEITITIFLEYFLLVLLVFNNIRNLCGWVWFFINFNLFI